MSLAVTVGSAEAVRAAAENGADIIYLQSTALRRGVPVEKEQYGELAEYCHGRQAALYWTCSPIQNDRQLERAAALMQAAKEHGAGRFRRASADHRASHALLRHHERKISMYNQFQRQIAQISKVPDLLQTQLR